MLHIWYAYFVLMQTFLAHSSPCRLFCITNPSVLLWLLLQNHTTIELGHFYKNHIMHYLDDFHVHNLKYGQLKFEFWTLRHLFFFFLNSQIFFWTQTLERLLPIYSLTFSHTAIIFNQDINKSVFYRQNLVKAAELPNSLTHKLVKFDCNFCKYRVVFLNRMLKCYRI